MANNVMETQVKKISLALGALVDGAYLWAGADKGIASELQGKDQGDTVYYRVTGLGDVSEISGITDGTQDYRGGAYEGDKFAPYSKNGQWDPASGTGYPNPATQGYAQLSTIKQVVVPVSVRDINVMYEVKAFERQCTSIGEALARAKVGQKMIKKVIKQQIVEDMTTITNIFEGRATEQGPNGSANQFIAFQLCGAHMKGFLDSELYGFMDWNVWGRITATGQQAVPCALAKPEFGKELVGSWTLINQLRIIPDLPLITMVATSGITMTSVEVNSAEVVPSGCTGNVPVKCLKFVFTGTDAAPNGGYVVVNLKQSNAYVKNVDGNDLDNGRNAQFLINLDKGVQSASAKTTTVMVEIPGWLKTHFSYYPDTTSSVNNLSGELVTRSAAAAGTYGVTIIRGENAQVWGTIDTINCEGAHYSKSSVEGVTIHENKQAEVRALKTYDRFDMVFASKLVEPRLASIVLMQLE